MKYVGDFIRGLRLGSNLSIEKFFNINIKDNLEIIVWKNWLWKADFKIFCFSFNFKNLHAEFYLNEDLSNSLSSLYSLNLN